MSLSRDEFRHICQTVVGPHSAVDKNTLYTAVCCAGKSVIRSHLDNLWPSDKHELDYDQAFGIFERLEDLVVDESDMKRIREQGVQLGLEQILEQVTTSRRESIRSCLEPFTKNGYLDLEKFVKAVETTKLETLSKLLQLQQPKVSSDDDKRTKVQPQDEVELHIRPRFRGILFTSPLRVVKHILDSEGPCRISLKVEWNSDMGTNHFINDIFGMVIDPSGSAVAVTSRLQDDLYVTDEFQLEPGSTFIVMGLGTNASIRSARSDKNRIALTSDNRLSKRFKMSLMNIFDMFDFDCDGLLSRSEYSSFAIATADTPPDDEEWELLTSQFDARDGSLTMAGFLFMHECEAFSGDDLAVPDIWESLYRLGYDSNLQLQYACPFSILIDNGLNIGTLAQLGTMTNNERDSILKGLFAWAEVDNQSDLGARIYRADYFGMMIIHYTGNQNVKTYRIDIAEERNVKWNFYHGRDDIDPTVCGKWVLVCSYRSTGDNHVAEFHFVAEATTSE